VHVTHFGNSHSGGALIGMLPASIDQQYDESSGQIWNANRLKIQIIVHVSEECLKVHLESFEA
jgi:hypothetical protein